LKFELKNPFYTFRQLKLRGEKLKCPVSLSRLKPFMKQVETGRNDLLYKRLKRKGKAPLTQIYNNNIIKKNHISTKLKLIFNSI